MVKGQMTKGENGNFGDFHSVVHVSMTRVISLTFQCSAHGGRISRLLAGPRLDGIVPSVLLHHMRTVKY